jgi:hypothetical protein
MSTHYPALAAVVFLLAALAASSQQSSAADPPGDAERIAEGSKFIFKGTVRRLRAATMDGVPVTDGTVVVRVDELLESPKEFRGYAGKDITLLLAKGSSAKVGEEAVFFTNGAAYGKSIAVREVGRIDAAGKAAAELRRQVAGASEKAADRQLAKLITSADLVVAGKVTRVEKSTKRAPAQPETEHDPMWREAVISVESVEKGKLEGKTVVVVFPASKDVMWAKAPKFTVGQEGVWLLHKGQFKGVKIDGHTALNPLDFHPKDKAQRVKRLIKAKE